MKKDRGIHVDTREADLVTRAKVALGIGALDLSGAHFVVGPDGQKYDGALLGNTRGGDVQIRVYGNPKDSRVSDSLASFIRSGLAAIESDRGYRAPIKVTSSDPKITYDNLGTRFPSGTVFIQNRDEKLVDLSRFSVRMEKVYRIAA